MVIDTIMVTRVIALNLISLFLLAWAALRMAWGSSNGLLLFAAGWTLKRPDVSPCRPVSKTVKVRTRHQYLLGFCPPSLKPIGASMLG